MRIHICPPTMYDLPYDATQSAGSFDGSALDSRTELLQLTTLGGLQAAINAVENQMTMLFVSLRQMEEIQDLLVSLWLDAHSHHTRYDKSLLMPLSKLNNVRELTLGGNISDAFEQELHEECFGSMETPA